MRRGVDIEFINKHFGFGIMNFEVECVKSAAVEKHAYTLNYCIFFHFSWFCYKSDASSSLWIVQSRLTAINLNLNSFYFRIMLSLNQLTLLAQGLEESANSSKNHLEKSNQYPLEKSLNSQINQTQSSSRSLFRKCKQVIQEQMLQIQSLSHENHALNEQIANLKQQLIAKTQKLNTVQTQISQITTINQNLHKQLTNLNHIIQHLTQHAAERQNLIKLVQNKNEALEGVVNKLKEQNQIYKEKCQLMEGTIQLINTENFRLEQSLREKEQETRAQVERLRRFKLSLEKTNEFHQADLEMVKRMPLSEQKIVLAEREEAYLQNPFNTITISRYPHMSNHQHKDSKRESDYKTADHTLQKASINNSIHTISPFSIVEQRPGVSRIRKNLSKPKQKSIIKGANDFASISLAPKLQSSLQNISVQKQMNPEIDSELSNIKKQLMKQYNMVELKKEMMNQGMIGRTLKQIEKKLEKMTRISAVDASQSDFE